ncbi:hypothetical protein U91I_00623 [alpha proteobacterium U9-1i]|nr:hypothetical protein U91I_00623 [alpha proteobacterium U9-1i]
MRSRVLVLEIFEGHFAYPLSCSQSLRIADGGPKSQLRDSGGEWREIWARSAPQSSSPTSRRGAARGARPGDREMGSRWRV